jgi:hypothetical protein
MFRKTECVPSQWATCNKVHFEILMQGKLRSRGTRPRAIAVTFWGLIPPTSGALRLYEFRNSRRSFPTRQFIWSPGKSCFPIKRTQIYNPRERIYAVCRHSTTQQCPIISETNISYQFGFGAMCCYRLLLAYTNESVLKTDRLSVN